MISGILAEEPPPLPYHPRRPGGEPRPIDLVLSEMAASGDSPSTLFARLAARLAAERVQVTAMMIFSAEAARADVGRAMADAFTNPDWPVAWIESAQGSGVAGVQVFGVRDTVVTRVRLGGVVVASTYVLGAARYCFIGGMHPSGVDRDPGDQLDEVLENAEAILKAAGFEFSDVARTWFYNRDILAWYTAFNARRTAKYERVRWRSGALPASTAVGAGNPHRAALSFSALAVRPASEPELLADLTVAAVGSPKQGPATAYGSSFSRAVVVGNCGRRRLYVSGTASIHPDGTTAHVDKPHEQIALTMEVVRSLLDCHGLGFGDVRRATAYFKERSVIPWFASWCADNDWRGTPVVPVVADVCRPELLFEIEVDAERPDRAG